MSLGEATIWGPSRDFSKEKKEEFREQRSANVWGSIISIASLSVRTGV